MSALSTRRPTINGIMGCFILPQNGVAEGAKHYASGVSSSQIVMGSSIDSLNGNGSTKRPMSLEVNPSIGYAAKTHREDPEEIEDGSLPCTPELSLDSENHVSSCPAGDEVLENDTRQLLSQFLKEYSGLSSPRWNESKAQATMRRVVENVLDKHRYTYNGMINKLSLDDRGDDVSFVSAVATSLFSDGATNWGRVVSLVAFGATVCKHLKDKGRENCVELVSEEITTYLISNQRDWLAKNNNWEGFVEFFRVTDPESSMRNTLMAFAGVFGIGATLALLTRIRKLPIFAYWQTIESAWTRHCFSCGVM
ncbi:induced myeloid leukemia cell differentiation protein Mcl-1b isoform X1 [Channa argus]|uniref:induced myeloid leukemia cell differentiation protein Mcl-1b isoform X1 n=2 Tax=Channa argus TaxID=215402 RepID=UPI003521D639